MQIDIINKELVALHDSILVEMRDDIDLKQIKLVFVSENFDKKITVTLKSVLNSRCVDWKYGNIVLDALIMNNKKRFIDVLKFVEDLNSIQIKKKTYINLLKRVMDRQVYIFEVNPSYGAYFVCLFKGIEIITIDRAQSPL